MNWDVHEPPARVGVQVGRAAGRGGDPGGGLCGDGSR